MTSVPSQPPEPQGHLVLLRHGETEWSKSGQHTGLTDLPLLPEGEEAARRVADLLSGWTFARVLVSPLQRARRTAELVQPSAPVVVDSRLREMSFGIWEGKSVAELRAEGGETFAAAERLGLDFHPPGGESPRQVMERIEGWTAEIATTGAPVVAVTHKAAIRALLALATGWDMTGRQPVKLDWKCLHFFIAHGDGKVTLDRPNAPLS